MNSRGESAIFQGSGSEAAYVAFVTVNGDASVRVDDDVVPGRQLLVELVFARVPVWGDVGVPCPKDYKYLVAVRNVLPYRIGPRDMRVQHALVAFTRRHQFQRKAVGVQPIFPVRDQRAEPMIRDARVQDLRARLIEVGRYVHVGSKKC